MRTKLIKQIHGTFASSSSLDVWLEKEIDLPFFPVKDMYIVVGKIEDTIQEVTYIVDEECIKCYVTEDDEIGEAQLHRAYHRSIDEIVQEYLDLGWNRRYKNV